MTGRGKRSPYSSNPDEGFENLRDIEELIVTSELRSESLPFLVVNGLRASRISGRGEINA